MALKKPARTVSAPVSPAAQEQIHNPGKMNLILQGLSEALEELTKKVDANSQILQEVVKKMNKIEVIEGMLKTIVDDYKEVKTRVDTTEEKLKQFECEKEKMADQLAILEYRRKENLLRFRNIPESDKDLKQQLTNEFTNLLSVKKEDMEGTIDKTVKKQIKETISFKVKKQKTI